MHIFRWAFGTVVYTVGVAMGAANPLFAWMKKKEVLLARFIQEQRDIEEEVVRAEKGKLQLHRPDRFRWIVEGAEPLEIVADGKKVWIYDPTVEQVTIQPLQVWKETTLFSVLMGDQKTLHAAYWVSVSGDNQTVRLRPKKNTEAYAEIVLSFRGSQLQEVVLREGDKSSMRFQFNFYRIEQKKPVEFSFRIPKGAAVEDQTTAASSQKTRVVE